MSCGAKRDREAWAKAGCYAPLPLELAIHAEKCRSCAQFFAEVKGARQLAADVTIHRLSPARLADIHSMLLAETRRSPRREFVTRGHRQRWQWPSAIALGLLAATAGAAAVQVGGRFRSRWTTPSIVPTSPAVVLGSSSDAFDISLGHVSDPAYGSVEDEGGSVFAVTASARVSSSAPSAHGLKKPPSADGAPDDTAFATAFRLLSSGKSGPAAIAFESLLANAQLDPSRRADVLYWASRAHAQANNRTLAEARARQYVDTYPNSLHYGDAALLLGDFARSRGARSQARSCYEKALAAARPATRTRAREAISLLDSD